MIKELKFFLRKKTTKNGIWLYLLQFFNTVIPIVTLPYVTRILGTSRYGMFSSSFNIIGYLQVVIEYGFAMSATREVAINNSKKNLDKIFTSVLYSRFLLLFLCLIFSLIYTSLWKVDTVQILSYWLMTISLIGMTIQENWVFQGLEDMKFIAIANILARSTTTLLIFTCVKKVDDLLIYSFLYALSPVISNVIGLLIVKTKYRIHLIRISFKDIITELKRGWYIFTTQFTSKVFGAIGVTFLTFMDTSITVGIFSAIQKIPNMLVLMWNPISTVLYPIVSKKMHHSFFEGEKFVLRLRRKILFIFAIPLILLAVLSKYVVLVAFGPNYVSGYLWLIPLLMWLLVAIDNNFWGIQILLGSSHDKEYSFCFMISVIATILFNLIFIKLWGGIGAAWAPFASESLLDVLLIWQVKVIEKKVKK